MFGSPMMVPPGDALTGQEEAQAVADVVKTGTDRIMCSWVAGMAGLPQPLLWPMHLAPPALGWNGFNGWVNV